MRILIIGTGRLAFHLGHALKRHGMELAGIAGRNAEHVAALAGELGCPGMGMEGPFPPADLRVVAVSDDAITAVAGRLPADGTPVVHISGSMPLGLLAPHAHRGVLWPIRSFSAGPPVDFNGVPLVVDADDDATLALLQGLASTLSRKVVHLPQEQRQRLHLSAVITSNFPVFLLREAERLLADHGIDPQLVHPLWKMAAEKALQDADAAVTGPARRGDVGTLEKHLALLAEEPELRRAYAALSTLIYHTYHPEHRGEDL